ncbi:MAG: hypothetical protein KAG28_10060 [Cocleimonas sp.]|nr:hypothetical protein [Cocleimonas sp.]
MNNNLLQSEAVYVAPDLRFISTLFVFTKGFPWRTFLQFFKDQELVTYPVSDQIFLLRLLAVQELLCLDDDALIKWARHQFQLISFLDIGYKMRVPSLETLVEFRSILEEVGILVPFRKQCQKMILMCDQQEGGENRNPKFILESVGRGSQRVIGLKTEDSEDQSKNKWIACPVCESQNVNKILPPHWVNVSDGDWCRCRFCGNKFRL